MWGTRRRWDPVPAPEFPSQEQGEGRHVEPQSSGGALDTSLGCQGRWQGERRRACGQREQRHGGGRMRGRTGKSGPERSGWRSAESGGRGWMQGLSPLQGLRSGQCMSHSMCGRCSDGEQVTGRKEGWSKGNSCDCVLDTEAPPQLGREPRVDSCPSRSRGSSLARPLGACGPAPPWTVGTSS